MKVWRKWMRGCKFLVVRRDGTVPTWPNFVIGARDPCAPAALRAYALEAEQRGLDQEYAQSVFDLADEFEVYRSKHGAGDPDQLPHRTDHPGIIDLMCLEGPRSVTLNVEGK